MAKLRFTQDNNTIRVDKLEAYVSIWHTGEVPVMVTHLTPDEANEAALALTSLAARVRAIQAAFPGDSSHDIPKPKPKPEPEPEPEPEPTWWQRLFG